MALSIELQVWDINRGCCLQVLIACDAVSPDFKVESAPDR